MQGCNSVASAGSRQGSRNAATILEALGRRKHSLDSEPLRRERSLVQTTVLSLALDRGRYSEVNTASVVHAHVAVRQHSMNMHTIPTGRQCWQRVPCIGRFCRTCSSRATHSRGGGSTSKAPALSPLSLSVRQHHSHCYPTAPDETQRP